MESYVYRNLNSYNSIIEKLINVMDFEVLNANDGCFFMNDNVDVNVNKRYTSIRVKNPAYNIRELKRIIVER